MSDTAELVEVWTYRRGDKYAMIFGEQVPCMNLVRERRLGDPSEVVKTTSAAPVPYMPQLFPLGRWELQRIDEVQDGDPYVGPVYFAFDAHQQVEAWTLDANGGYAAPSGQMVEDSGYGIHHARFFDGTAWVDSRTTWGCLNLWYGADGWENKIKALAAKTKEFLALRGRVFVEVTA